MGLYYYLICRRAFLVNGSFNQYWDKCWLRAQCLLNIECWIHTMSACHPLSYWGDTLYYGEYITFNRKNSLKWPKYSLVISLDITSNLRLINIQYMYKFMYSLRISAINFRLPTLWQSDFKLYLIICLIKLQFLYNPFYFIPLSLVFPIFRIYAIT